MEIRIAWSIQSHYIVLNNVALREPKVIILYIFAAASPKVNQYFYKWRRYCIPNINLCQRVLKTLCLQEIVTDRQVEITKPILPFFKVGGIEISQDILKIGLQESTTTLIITD